MAEPEKAASPEGYDAVTAQPQPLVTAPAYRESVTPHSYAVLSTLVTIFCGIFSVCTLPIAIPGVVFSVLVSLYIN